MLFSLPFVFSMLSTGGSTVTNGGSTVTNGGTELTTNDTMLNNTMVNGSVNGSGFVDGKNVTGYLTKNGSTVNANATSYGEKTSPFFMLVLLFIQ
jgi:hypothetical protein